MRGDVMEAQFGMQIRKMRKAFGLTQAEFAEKSGISMMSLRRYETNERQPTMQIITRMAAALGLTVGEFLWSDPASKRPYFWSAELEEKLKQVGCSTGWAEEDGFLWINYPDGALEVSEKDLKRAVNLGSTRNGEGHDNFLKGILVQMDVLAPLYWWKEFDTYKVGTVANSCSTMHKIHAEKFTPDDFSLENLFNEDNGEEDQEHYNLWLDHMKLTVIMLNRARERYLETKDKKYWWQMIQLLPSSYNQKRTVMLNYEVLNNMYKSRCLHPHKLDEWSIGFKEWVESLPYSKELIVNG